MMERTMTTRRGMLVALHGAWGSGLAMLTVDEEVPGGATRLVTIPCDAGPTSRALRTVSGDEVAGQGVYFSTDNIGALEGFAPIEDADAEVAL
jgi:hypothetical protein